MHQPRPRYDEELKRACVRLVVVNRYLFGAGWGKPLRGCRRQKADCWLTCMAQRRDIIRHVEFRRRGWQISSDPTAAQCKSTTLRLQGRGCRWDPHQAGALMAPAAIDAS